MVSVTCAAPCFGFQGDLQVIRQAVRERTEDLRYHDHADRLAYPKQHEINGM